MWQSLQASETRDNHIGIQRSVQSGSYRSEDL